MLLTAPAENGVLNDPREQRVPGKSYALPRILPHKDNDFKQVQ